MQSPDHFEFFSQPKIISGNKALEHIPIELAELSAKKPLVLISKNKDTKKRIKTFKKAMADSNITIGAFYDNISDVPEISEIRELADLYIARGCDVIIAIGDEVTMFTAKAVNIQVSGDKDFFEYSSETLDFPLKPLISVMTVESVGRVTTSVVCIDRHTYNSPFLFPDLIVIDSKMLKNCSKDKVIDAGVIALTQIVEAASKNNNNPMNDTYLFTGGQLLFENLPKLVKCTRNKKAGIAVANAAAFGGISFSNSSAKITYILANTLAVVTGFNPAELMRIILPFSLNHKSKIKSKAKGKSKTKGNSIRPELLQAIAGINTFAKTPESERSDKAIGLTMELINSLSKGKAKSLKELNIPEYKLEEAAKISMNKVKFETSVEELTEILLSAWNGKSSEDNK